MTSPFSPFIGRIDEAHWNTLLDGFDDANIYQTWAYGGVHWGEKQLEHLALLRDGSPCAIAQLRVVRVPVLGSGIAYVRWGPLWARTGSPIDLTVCRATIDALMQNYVVRQGLVLRIIPNAFREDRMASTIREICKDCGLREDVEARAYSSFRIDLRRSTDVLRGQLSGRWRRQLNIAERNRLDVVEGHKEELFETFHHLYREMMARKQFDTTVDPAKMGRMQRQLPDSQKMTVLICSDGGTPVAGLVVAAAGKVGIYLLAATGNAGLQARGSYLLQWRAMQMLRDRGVEWYDLGGINQQTNPGVFAFKSGMGGEQVSHLGVYYASNGNLSRWSVSVAESLRGLGARWRRRA